MRRKSFCTVYIWGLKSYVPRPFRVEYLCNLLGILLHGRFVCPCQFTRSFIYISVDTWDIYVIIGYNTMLLYFVAQIVPALDIGSSFSCLLWPAPILLIFSFKKKFFLALSSWHCKVFQAHFVYIFFKSQSEESLISLKDLNSFYWRRVLEPRYVCSLLLGCCFL